jgi:hypothetical protein
MSGKNRSRFISIATPPDLGSDARFTDLSDAMEWRLRHDEEVAGHTLSTAQHHCYVTRREHVNCLLTSLVVRSHGHVTV